MFSMAIGNIGQPQTAIPAKLSDRPADILGNNMFITTY